MDNGDTLPFSNILAGALLIKKSISYVELSNYICLFEEVTNKYIIDDNLFKIYDIVYCKNDGFELKYDYDFCFNHICTVEESLYRMTTPEIRTFFGYKDKENKKETADKKQLGLLKKIRTRVFHLI